MAEDGKTDGMTVGMADGQRQTYTIYIYMYSGYLKDVITILGGLNFTYFFFVLISFSLSVKTQMTKFKT